MADRFLLPPGPARTTGLASRLRFGTRAPNATGTTAPRIATCITKGVPKAPSAATNRVLRITVSSLVAAVLGAQVVGCQAPSSGVASVPPPSFNGPNVATPAPVRPVEQPKPAAPATPPPPVARATVPLDGPKAWAPKAQARGWKWIVIHHSATPAGDAAEFDKMHKSKGWDELGYHFVIGNGTNSGDGQIEVGPRWAKQKYGAHTKTADNRFNDYGIGICLVGNFDLERPTPKQMQSLARLTAYLMKTYRVPASRIIGHGDAKATECPGRFMDLAHLKRMAGQALANAGEPGDPDALAAGDETADELLRSDATR
jgi:hypothetical protein